MLYGQLLTQSLSTAELGFEWFGAYWEPQPGLGPKVCQPFTYGEPEVCL